MSRSWWLRAVLFLLLIGGAVVLLIPIFVPWENQPEFIRRYIHREMRRDIDIQGGIRLAYEVDMEAAIKLKIDTLARGLETILPEDLGTAALRIVREGPADVVVSSPVPRPELSYRRLRESSGGWLMEVDRDHPVGSIRLRFDPAKTTELRESAIRAGIDVIEGRMDSYRCNGERVVREGDRIVVELPGMKSADLARVKSVISRSSTLRFAAVDGNPDYIRKIAAALPPDSGIEMVREVLGEPLFRGPPPVSLRPASP
jgi:preprotein translocase subunit SecD